MCKAKIFGLINLLLAVAVSISGEVNSMSSAETLTPKLDPYFKGQTESGFSGAVLVARNGRVIFEEL